MTEPLTWPELAREPVANCKVFSVERSIAASPLDGAKHSFYRIQSVDWAQIVPVTKAGEVVLVRQYRHGAQKVTLEMPAGMIDPGEDPAVAALRECFEETGYRAAKAVSLGAVNPNAALFANRLHAFAAFDVELAGAIQNTGTEQTEVVLMPLDKIEGLLLSGEMDHALVVATMWRFLHDFGRR